MLSDGVGALSSFVIVPMALPSPRVAPATLLTATLKVSFGSTVVSPLIVTLTVAEVLPAGIVTPVCDSAT